MTQYQILIPLWGKTHAFIFSKVVLPSLLMPGNLPYLGSHADATLKIVCPAKEAEAIAKSAAFEDAKRALKVRFLVQTPPEADQHVHNYHRATAYYRAAMQQPDVIPGQTAFVFLTPDGVYGDGSFKAMANRCEEGYKVIMIPGPRVIQETFLPDYHRLFGPDNSGIKMSNRNLVQMFLKHMHRISQSSFVDGNRPLYNRHPAHMYWEVPGEGLLSRSFVNHPLLIKPDRHVLDFPTTIDQILAPLSVGSLENMYLCKDSDEMFGVDLAPYHYDQNTIDYYRHSQAQKSRRISHWINGGWATAFHLWQATQISRIHNSDLTPQWHTIEVESERFVTKVLAKEGFSPGFLQVKERYVKLLDPWKQARFSPDHASRPPRGRLERLNQTLPMRILMSLATRFGLREPEKAIQRLNHVLEASAEAANIRVQQSLVAESTLSTVAPNTDNPMELLKATELLLNAHRDVHASRFRAGAVLVTLFVVSWLTILTLYVIFR